MGKYFGIFERIKNTYSDKIVECPLYYKDAAKLYDTVSVAYDDYPMFLQQSLLFGGPILELCCGSGRITLPLLKAGFEITAVDLSEDMLRTMSSLVEKNKRYARHKEKLKIIKADMTKLNLEDKYNLIIIGATSIRLMEDDFVDFFNNMYNLLNEGGCLFFNFEDLPIVENKKEHIEELGVSDLPNELDDLNLLLIQRMIDYSEKRAYVNFLSMSNDSKKNVLLSKTDYRIFGVEDIRNAVERSKFGECEIVSAGHLDNFYCKMIKI